MVSFLSSVPVGQAEIRFGHRLLVRWRLLRNRLRQKATIFTLVPKRWTSATTPPHPQRPRRRWPHQCALPHHEAPLPDGV